MQDQSQQTSGGEQPLLELSNVSKHFGGVMALQNVDFTLLPARHLPVARNAQPAMATA